MAMAIVLSRPAAVGWGLILFGMGALALHVPWAIWAAKGTRRRTDT